MQALPDRFFGSAGFGPDSSRMKLTASIDGVGTRFPSAALQTIIYARTRQRDKRSHRRAGNKNSERCSSNDRKRCESEIGPSMSRNTVLTRTSASSVDDTGTSPPRCSSVSRTDFSPIRLPHARCSDARSPLDARRTPPPCPSARPLRAFHTVPDANTRTSQRSTVSTRSMRKRDKHLNGKE